MFECFARSHVCLSVPPHIENNSLVWMFDFISILVLGGREVDWFLDLYLFWGWGGGGGEFSFEKFFLWVGVVLLGVLRGLFFIKGIIFY